MIKFNSYNWQLFKSKLKLNNQKQFSELKKKKKIGEIKNSI
jgi:hypothetical protein